MDLAPGIDFPAPIFPPGPDSPFPIPTLPNPHSDSWEKGLTYVNYDIYDMSRECSSVYSDDTTR